MPLLKCAHWRSALISRTLQGYMNGACVDQNLPCSVLITFVNPRRFYLQIHFVGHCPLVLFTRQKLEMARLFSASFPDGVGTV